VQTCGVRAMNESRPFPDAMYAPPLRWKAWFKKKDNVVPLIAWRTSMGITSGWDDKEGQKLTPLKNDQSESDQKKLLGFGFGKSKQNDLWPRGRWLARWGCCNYGQVHGIIPVFILS